MIFYCAASLRIRLALPKVGCPDFCRQIPTQIPPANFASETFRRKSSKTKNIVVVVAVKSWVVVPENLRNTKECLSARCAWGDAPSGPVGRRLEQDFTLDLELRRRVTDTKQNCPCYEQKKGARLRGRTLQGGVLGTFWKPLLRTPSENPFQCVVYLEWWTVRRVGQDRMSKLGRRVQLCYRRSLSFAL